MVAAYAGKQSNPVNRHARMYPSYRQNLSPTAYLVLGTLREYIFDEESRLVDYSWLVDATGLSYGAISRAMQELADQGFIHRERDSSGRGSHYRVTMLLPPEKRSPDSFFESEKNPERIQNESPEILSEPAESPTTTPQNVDFLPPIMLSDHHKQKQQEVVEVISPSEFNQEKTTREPHQMELAAVLEHMNAGAVADQIIQLCPDLTVDDLSTDLAAAKARPSVYSPLGLVCSAWLAGSRVTAPRSEPAAAELPPPAQLHEPPDETEQFLLDLGFSAKAAREFATFDLDAVDAACDQAFSPLDTSHERNQKIGKLVVRWRRQPPTRAREEAGDSPAGKGAESVVSSASDMPGEASDPPAGAGPDMIAPAPDASEEPAEEEADHAATIRFGRGNIPVDTSSLDGIWRAVQGSLQMMLSRSDYSFNLQQTRLLALHDNRAIIGCANSYQKEQIENRYLGTIRQVVRDILGHPVEVLVRLC